MILQVHQVIYDKMHAGFEAMGTGGRYCRQQKDYALKLISDGAGIDRERALRGTAGVNR